MKSIDPDALARLVEETLKVLEPFAMLFELIDCTSGAHQYGDEETWRDWLALAFPRKPEAEKFVTDILEAEVKFGDLRRAADLHSKLIALRDVKGST